MEEYNKLKASYDALQRDYTKKCQMLKKLQMEDNKVDKNLSPTLPEIDFLNLNDTQLQQILQNPIVLKAATQMYVESLRNGQSPIFITANGKIKACENIAPKSIREAGDMAKRVLKLR